MAIVLKHKIKIGNKLQVLKILFLDRKKIERALETYGKTANSGKAAEVVLWDSGEMLLEILISLYPFLY